MSSTVKIHTNQSNRSKPTGSQKKPVFKPVLDNPFRIYWPSVPVNLQNLILAQVVTLLDGIAEYNRSKSTLNRKRKREKREKENPRKKKKTNEEEMAVDEEQDQNVPSAPEQEQIVSEQPSILSHLTVGINAVTKRLENQLRRRRRDVTITSSSASESTPESLPPPLIRLVLVCRTDINPPILIDHLPHTIAAYNSSLSSDEASEPILLVPLPAGAEHTLADVFNLRRVAVIAFDDGTPNIETLLKDGIPTLSAPWLAPPPHNHPKQIIPTHIKQLRTTAPKDMKAAKEERVVGRTAAKERKKGKGKEQAGAGKKVVNITEMSTS